MTRRATARVAPRCAVIDSFKYDENDVSGKTHPRLTGGDATSGVGAGLAPARGGLPKILMNTW